jgi:hypothetical protein
MPKEDKVTVIKNKEPLKNVRVLLIGAEISQIARERFAMETRHNILIIKKAQCDKLEKQEIVLVNSAFFLRLRIPLERNAIIIGTKGNAKPHLRLKLNQAYLKTDYR